MTAPTHPDEDQAVREVLDSVRDNLNRSDAWRIEHRLTLEPNGDSVVEITISATKYAKRD